MKKYLLIFNFLIICFYLNLSSKEIQISNPIVSDYYDCIYKDNQIIVYGTNGIINISNDDGKSWTTQKIFDRGKIVFMSYEDDGIYAINENCDIVKSNNLGRYFVKYKKLNENLISKIWTVKKINDFFIVRTNNKLLKYDLEFNYLTTTNIPDLIEKFYINIDSTLTNYTNNIIYFQNKLIVSLDSSSFYIYDNNLNFIEKWEFFYKFNETYEMANIFVLDNQIMFSTYDMLYKYNIANNKLDTIYNFQDPNNKYSPFLKVVVDDKFMFLPSQSKEQYKLHFINISGERDTTVQVINNTFVAQYGTKYNLNKTINKVVKKDNKYILLGDRNTKIIVETELDSDGKVICKTNEISKCYGFNPDLLAEPFRLDDKVIFTFQKKNGYEQYMFELNDNSEIIKAVIPEYKLEDGKFNTNVMRARNLVRLRNYNPKTNELKLFSTFDNYTFEAYYFSTKDFFKDKIEYLQVNDNILGHNSSQTFNYTDLLNFNDKFIVGKYIEEDYPNYTSKIYTYNYGFTSNDTYTIQDEFGKNKRLEYIYSENDQKYFLIYYDYNKSTLEFKTSNNTFDNYQSLYTLKNTIEFLKYKNVELGGIPFVIYLLFDNENYKYTIELLNLRNYTKHTLMEFEDEIIENKYINFDIYQEKIYLSLGNKFLHFKGTLSKPEWEEYSLPNNGMIDNYMYIQNNFLYCKYKDDKNDLNLYRIELVDSLVNSVEIDKNLDINNSEYVFLYQPYPNPTNNEINTEVFWSNSFDIDNSDIGVFNLNGIKVSSHTSLTLEKLNVNKGNIKWNCVGQPKGTYLIKIQHGNNTKTVKVVVD